MALDNILHQLTTTPDEIPADRMRGTSTGLAFRYVANAILNNDVRFVVQDHVGTKGANRFLLYKIRSLIKHNRLIGFSEGQNIDGTFWIMCSIKREI